MLFLIRLLTSLALALPAAVLLEWTTPGYLKLGGVAAIVCAAITFSLMWASRTRPVKGLRIPPSQLREVFIGLLSAALWVGLVQLYFFVALNTAAIVDRDREDIERTATLLEDAGNYKAASKHLLAALNETHTPEFIRILAQRVIVDLSRAAQSAEGRECRDLLLQAIKVADRYQVSDDLPQAILGRLNDTDAVAGLTQQIDSAREQAAKAQAEHDRLLLEKKQWEAKAGQVQRQHTAEIDELKRRSGDLTASLRRLARLALNHGALLSGNAVDGDLAAARKTLLSLIQQTGVSEAAATDALKTLEAAILDAQPADLPAEVTARIRRIDTEVMPGMALIDIEVFDAFGKPIAGLLGKDFVAIQRGAKLKAFASPFSKTEPLAASILIDTSASTEGAPLAATKAAIPEFIARLSDNASLRITSFSDELNVLADFTNDKAKAIAAVNGIRADGGTALYQSSFQEIRVLSARSGVRVLVVFTDGANSLPGPRVEEVIRAARDANVAVHFVALKGTGYSDTSEIERIASETGGKTLLVHQAARLSETFRALSESLQLTGYRLAVFGFDASVPMQINIGGAGAVQLSIDPNLATPSLAQRQGN